MPTKGVKAGKGMPATTIADQCFREYATAAVRWTARLGTTTGVDSVDSEDSDASGDEDSSYDEQIQAIQREQAHLLRVAIELASDEAAAGARAKSKSKKRRNKKGLMSLVERQMQSFCARYDNLLQVQIDRNVAEQRLDALVFTHRARVDLLIDVCNVIKPADGEDGGVNLLSVVALLAGLDHRRFRTFDGRLQSSGKEFDGKKLYRVARAANGILAMSRSGNQQGVPHVALVATLRKTLHGFTTSREVKDELAVSHDTFRKTLEAREGKIIKDVATFRAANPNVILVGVWDNLVVRIKSALQHAHDAAIHELNQVGTAFFHPPDQVADLCDCAAIWACIAPPGQNPFYKTYAALTVGCPCSSHPTEALTAEDLGNLVHSAERHPITGGRVVTSDNGCIYVEFSDPFHLVDLLPLLFEPHPDTPAPLYHDGESSYDAVKRQQRDIREENIDRMNVLADTFKQLPEARQHYPKHRDTRVDDHRRRFPQKYEGNPQDGNIKPMWMIPQPIIPIAEQDASKTVDLVSILVGDGHRDKVLRRRDRRTSLDPSVKTTSGHHGDANAGLVGPTDVRDIFACDQLSAEIIASANIFAGELLQKTLSEQDAAELMADLETFAMYSDNLKATLHYYMHMLSESAGPFDTTFVAWMIAHLNKRNLDFKPGREGQKVSVKTAFLRTLTDASYIVIPRDYHASAFYPSHLAAADFQTDAGRNSYHEGLDKYIAAKVAAGNDTDFFELYSVSWLGFANADRYARDTRLGNTQGQQLAELRQVERWERANKKKFVIRDIADIVELAATSQRRGILHAMQRGSNLQSNDEQKQQGGDHMQEFIIWLSKRLTSNSHNDHLARKLNLISGNLDLFVALRSAENSEKTSGTRFSVTPANLPDVMAVVDVLTVSDVVSATPRTDGVGGLLVQLQTREKSLPFDMWHRLLSNKDVAPCQNGVQITAANAVTAEIGLVVGDIICAVYIPDTSRPTVVLDGLGWSDLRDYGSTLNISGFSKLTSKTEFLQAIKEHFSRKRVSTKVDACDTEGKLAYRWHTLTGCLGAPQGVTVGGVIRPTTSMRQTLASAEIPTTFHTSQSGTIRIYRKGQAIRRQDVPLASARAGERKSKMRVKMGESRRPDDGGDGTSHEKWDPFAYMQSKKPSFTTRALQERQALRNIKKLQSKEKQAVGAMTAQRGTRWPVSSRLRTDGDLDGFSNTAGYARAVGRNRKRDGTRDQIEQALTGELKIESPPPAAGQDSSTTPGGSGSNVTSGAWSFADRQTEEALLIKQQKLFAEFARINQEINSADNGRVSWHHTHVKNRTEGVVYLLQTDLSVEALALERLEIAVAKVSAIATELAEHQAAAALRAAGAASEQDDEQDSDGSEGSDDGTSSNRVVIVLGGNTAGADESDGDSVTGSGNDDADSDSDAGTDGGSDDGNGGGAARRVVTRVGNNGRSTRRRPNPAGLISA